MSTKSAKSPHEQAFEQAEKEINEEQVAQIKVLMKDILQKQQEYKEQKEEAEEALRLLKLDLDDLRAGKIDKIQERHQKSKKADVYFPFGPQTAVMDLSLNPGGSNWVYGMFKEHEKMWNDLTSGTYTISCSNGTVKEFYL